MQILGGKQSALEIILLKTNQLNKWPFLREGFDSCIFVKKVFRIWEKFEVTFGNTLNNQKGNTDDNPEQLIVSH